MSKVFYLVLYLILSTWLSVTAILDDDIAEARALGHLVLIAESTQSEKRAHINLDLGDLLKTPQSFKEERARLSEALRVCFDAPIQQETRDARRASIEEIVKKLLRLDSNETRVALSKAAIAVQHEVRFLQSAPPSQKQLKAVLDAFDQFCGIYRKKTPSSIKEAKRHLREREAAWPQTPLKEWREEDRRFLERLSIYAGLFRQEPFVLHGMRPITIVKKPSSTVDTLLITIEGRFPKGIRCPFTFENAWRALGASFSQVIVTYEGPLQLRMPQLKGIPITFLSGQMVVTTSGNIVGTPTHPLFYEGAISQGTVTLLGAPLTTIDPASPMINALSSQSFFDEETRTWVPL